jgi:exodeoxyribonuclease-5
VNYISPLDWGYLRTCHAVQGYEYEDVTVIDDSRLLGGIVDPAKWLYTAITRASDRLTVLLRD